MLRIEIYSRDPINPNEDHWLMVQVSDSKKLRLEYSQSFFARPIKPDDTQRSYAWSFDYCDLADVSRVFAGCLPGSSFANYTGWFLNHSILKDNVEILQVNALAADYLLADFNRFQGRIVVGFGMAFSFDDWIPSVAALSWSMAPCLQARN